MATNNNLVVNQTPTPLSSPQRKPPQQPPKDTPSRQLNPNSAPFQPSSIAMNNIPTVSVSSPASSSYHSIQNDSISLSNDSINASSSSSGSSSASNGRSRNRRARRGQSRPSTSSAETDGDSQQSRAEDEEYEEDSESDVEIYLSTIDLNSSLIDEHPISFGFHSNTSFDNSTSNGQSQIFNDNEHNLFARPSNQNPALPDDSPVLPKPHILASASQSTILPKSSTRIPVHSPPPPAPLRQTVPLPDVGSDSEAPALINIDSSSRNGHAVEARSSSRPSTGKKSTAPELQEKSRSTSRNEDDSTPSSTVAAKGSTPPTRSGLGSGQPDGIHVVPKLTINTQASMSSISSDLKSPVDSKSPTGSTFGTDTKTKNVYINGLPPHFPEQELYKLAASYGEIRSVRTFTRHVRDSESGYGFVLFETVEAAERCIQDLRRYRNLHPTFSKTSHKIPGTYAAADLTLPPSSSDVLLDWEQNQSGLQTELSNGDLTGCDLRGSDSMPEVIGTSSCERREPAREASFKAKMESLHDPTSTNLYIEGLPLSIDEATLAALVSPHKISSSRFFQTRLSNPPRIIAFVRLETRVGAEEVIERLHGRMVRGWNDSGSRISVRFADTAEQRELRRTERTTRDGDNSPARLTIAQASLLSLRGQELQPGRHGLSPSASNPSISSNNARSSLPPPPILLDRLAPPQPGLQSSRSLGLSDSYSSYDLARAHTPPFAVDYSLVQGGQPLSRTHSPVYYPQQQLPPSPYHSSSNLLSLQQQQQMLQQQALNLSYQQNQTDPQMLALLDSLRASGSPFQPNHINPALLSRARHIGVDNTIQHNGLGPHNVGPRLGGSGVPIVAGRGAVQARSGYTATEEYIMRAHLEGQSQQQAALDYLDAAGNNSAVNHMILRNNGPRPAQQDYAARCNDIQQVHDRRRPAPLDLAFQRQQLLDQSEAQQLLDSMQRRDRSDSLGIASTANIGVGVRGYRTQAAILEHHGLQHQNYSLDEGVPRDAQTSRHSNGRHPSINSLQQILSPKISNTSNPMPSSSGNTFQHAHLRSSTLPYRTPSRGQQRHSQTSSMSAAAPALGHSRQDSQQSSQQPHFPHSRGTGSLSGGINANAHDFNVNEQVLSGSETSSAMASPDMNDVTISNPGMGSKSYLQAQLQQRHLLREYEQGNGLKTAAGALAAGAYDQDLGSNNTSPSLSIISPALSYSANTPASTLSPATPFFNSFGNSGVQIGTVGDGPSPLMGSGKGNGVTMSSVQAAFASAKLRNGGQ